jgi:hypothetical protein
MRVKKEGREEKSQEKGRRRKRKRNKFMLCYMGIQYTKITVYKDQLNENLVTMYLL